MSKDDLTGKQKREALRDTNWDGGPPNPNENCLAGMKCPTCGSFGRFAVEIVIRGTVWMEDDGWDEPPRDGGEWDDASYCQCGECGFTGVVKDFKGSGRRARQPQRRGLIARV
jgi:hypothetical protein